MWRELVLEEIIPQHGLSQVARIKIKIEVDTLPPPGFDTEEKLLLKPFSFYVKCFTLPDLFAGKMHALLFRKWGTNVKGRDWFDLEWYIRNGVALHLAHFTERARDSGDWDKATMTSEELHQSILTKINSVNMDRVKADITRFIPDPRVLDIWSVSYFRDLMGYLKIV